MYKIIGKRFLKGFVSGAVGLMVVAVGSVNDITTWADLGNSLNLMAMAGIAGGISGGLLAVEKYLKIK